MPWKETCAMDERMRFVIAAREEGAVFAAVCAAFGISRTTGYTWLSRYRAAGPAGLVDRSRAPHRHGRARPEALVEAALALRGRYPTWGPRKLAGEARRAVAAGAAAGGEHDRRLAA